MIGNFFWQFTWHFRNQQFTSKLRISCCYYSTNYLFSGISIFAWRWTDELWSMYKSMFDSACLSFHLTSMSFFKNGCNWLLNVSDYPYLVSRAAPHDKSSNIASQTECEADQDPKFRWIHLWCFFQSLTFIVKGVFSKPSGNCIVAPNLCFFQLETSN